MTGLLTAIIVLLIIIGILFKTLQVLEQGTTDLNYLTNTVIEWYHNRRH